MKSTSFKRSSPRSAEVSSSATAAGSCSNKRTTTFQGTFYQSRRQSSGGHKLGSERYYRVSGFAMMQTKGKSVVARLTLSLIIGAKDVATLRLKEK